MPFDDAGVYTPPNGATNAFPGQVIASATWNSIFTDISEALTTLAQSGGAVQEPAIETAAGPFAITTETYIALNKGAPSATTITLPAVATRDNQQITIVDWAGNAGDITITPFAGETIMGVSSWTVASSGGAGFGGKITLRPSVDLAGWTVLA